ncbi:hypothetical protein [Methylobacterium trifolii]|uniref:Uncharacterized protein n=1 Tax=Methylobacterium trifolii TaxID=1003092 RepID=A0ABQ4U7F1_9HYPH|nr:hypothetical protein [Methylobacterium trifolii]GJE62721.1 hypothetical protein MPOCJGCO_4856 [Methylobacterium trifolii]
MDVVLKQVGPDPINWSLTDRLGRTLGAIEKSAKPATFKILAQPGTALDGIKVEHLSLDAVMTAIATRMAGACSLDSQA